MTMGTYTVAGILPESSYGVTPSAAVQLMALNTIEIGQDRSVERPNIFSGDRRNFPTRLLRKAGNVRLGGPSRYENTLDLIEGLMNADRAAAVTVTATTISFVASTNKILDSGSGFTNLLSGDLIKVTGTANNNRVFGPITKNDNGDISCPAGQVTDESAGSSFTIKTQRLLDGTTFKSYQIERQLTKLTNHFKQAKGGVVGTGRFRFGENAFFEEEFTLMARHPAYASATLGTGGPTAAPVKPFLAGGEDFLEVEWGGIGAGANSAIVTSLDLNIGNTIAGIYGLGNQGLGSVEVGKLNADLSLSLYLDDNADLFLDASDAHASTTLWVWWLIGDASGDQMAICLPALKPDGATDNVQGADNPVSAEISLTAHDPAKDDVSTWNGVFAYQAGFFFFPSS